MVFVDELVMSFRGGCFRGGTPTPTGLGVRDRRLARPSLDDQQPGIRFPQRRPGLKFVVSGSPPSDFSILDNLHENARTKCNEHRRKDRRDRIRPQSLAKAEIKGNERHD
jgi:hypothetical protein